MKQKSKSSNQKYYKMTKLPTKCLKYRLRYLPASPVKIEFIQYPRRLLLKVRTGGNFSHLFDHLYVLYNASLTGSGTRVLGMVVKCLLSLCYSKIPSRCTLPLKTEKSDPHGRSIMNVRHSKKAQMQAVAVTLL